MKRRRWLGLTALPLVAVLLLGACAEDEEPEADLPEVATAEGGGLVVTPTDTPEDADASPTGTAPGGGASSADLDMWQDRIEELATELDFEVTDVDASTDGLVVGTTLTADQASQAQEVCDAVQELNLGGMASVVIEGDDGSTLLECEA